MTIEDLLAVEECPKSDAHKIPQDLVQRLLSMITVNEPVFLELALPGPHSLKLIGQGCELYLSATGLVTGRFGRIPVTVSL